MQDKRGKLWFATIDGVYVYDGESFTLFIIDEAANGSLGSNDKAERIIEDNAGNIWFGGRTNEGVYRYDGKSFTCFTIKDGLANSGVRSVPEDKTRNIWVGT